jgi:hypothetical protein
VIKSDKLLYDWHRLWVSFTQPTLRKSPDVAALYSGMMTMTHVPISVDEVRTSIPEIPHKD